MDPTSLLMNSIENPFKLGSVENQMNELYEMDPTGL